MLVCTVLLSFIVVLVIFDYTLELLVKLHLHCFDNYHIQSNFREGGGTFVVARIIHCSLETFMDFSIPWYKFRELM